jgi:hypothetical protein
MSARILDFQTRDNYMRLPLEDVIEMTPGELYDVLYEMSLDKLDALVHLYKSTGQWSPTTENIMRRMRNDTQTICAALAGVPPNGSPQKKSPTFTIPIGPVNFGNVG